MVGPIDTGPCIANLRLTMSVKRPSGSDGVDGAPTPALLGYPNAASAPEALPIKNERLCFRSQLTL